VTREPIALAAWFPPQVTPNPTTAVVARTNPNCRLARQTIPNLPAIRAKLTDRRRPLAHTDRSSGSHVARTQTDNLRRPVPHLSTAVPSTQPRAKPTAPQSLCDKSRRTKLPRNLSLSPLRLHFAAASHASDVAIHSRRAVECQPAVRLLRHAKQCPPLEGRAASLGCRY